MQITAFSILFSYFSILIYQNPKMWLSLEISTESNVFEPSEEKKRLLNRILQSKLYFILHKLH